MRLPSMVGLRRLVPCPAARLRENAGFTLVEVMVSSSLLVALAFGIYAVVDGATQSTSRNKNRSVAASLAQQDVDRLRGKRLSELVSYSETRTRRLPSPQGVQYTIVSRGEWVSDGGTAATNACAQTGSTNDYAKITSTVTWRDMGSMRPVVLEALVPPTIGAYAGQGNLAVRVKRRDGTGVGAQTVTASASGQTTRSGATDANGCVFYDFLNAATWSMAFSRTGFVDSLGASAVTGSVLVNEGGTVGSDFVYDEAGRIRADFQTRRIGTTIPVTQSAPATVMTVEKHTGAPSGTWVPALTWSTSPAATSITTSKAFHPFTSAYSVFAGNCTSNKPTGGVSYGPLVTPGADPASATVRVPALNIRVQNESNTTVSGARVKVTPTGTSGCVGTAPGQTTYASQLTTAAAGDQPAGALPNPGFPWGTYTICAQVNYGAVGTTNNIYSTTVTGVNNTDEAGTTLRTIRVRNTTTGGTSVRAQCAGVNTP